MANELTRLGYKLSTDGTDNHLVLIDLKPQKITGSKVELVCDEVNITLNKNAVIGDKNPMNPGGVRIGTPAMTTRGATEEDFIKIVNYFDTAVKLGQEIQLKSGPKLADFKNVLHSTEYKVKLETLRNEIETWVSTFEFY
jgi:glycine hydroxymethyltransferase